MRQTKRQDGQSSTLLQRLGGIKKTTRTDFLTYIGVTVVFLVMFVLQGQGQLSNSLSGQLVPICCYIVMAVSLNLVVGVSGELSLGHAGFMSVGAFTGVIAAQSLQEAVPAGGPRLLLAILVGIVFAALAGVIVGVPVLRLRGDYLAIVTLAFGEIIKELINCLIVGWDENGLHIIFNISGTQSINDLGLSESGIAIIKGAQGATITRISTFLAGYLLIMVTLIVVLNLMRSRSGRAIMAIRDNRIAAEATGLSVMKYKLMAFVVSAALAGGAGALYGLNFSTLVSSTFDFNTSILVLVFVVLGGIGNIWGSVISAAVLTLLPELLREFDTYRMLVYAIVLILVMLVTNNEWLRQLPERVRERLGEKKGGVRQ